MSRIPIPRPLWVQVVVLAVALLPCLGTPIRAAPTMPSADDDTLTARHVAFTLRHGAVISPGRPGDRWFGRDKAKHVVFSTLWTLSTQYVLVNKVGWSEEQSLPASIGSGALIGVTKEVYDARKPQRDASGKDLIADVVGIGIAVTIIAL